MKSRTAPSARALVQQLVGMLTVGAQLAPDDRRCLTQPRADRRA
jgi:hypothetical protein